MRFNFFRSIKVQISTFYLISNIVAVSMIGIILYYTIFNIELKQNLNYTKTTIDKSGNYIELYINKMKTVENLLAKSTEVANYLKMKEGEKLEIQVRSLIDNTLGLDSSIKSIILVSKDGRVVSNEKELSMTKSKDMMGESWYKAALDSENMPVLTGARMQSFSMDKDNWVISLSQEVKDADGKNLGVILIDIKYNVIENFLKDLNKEDNSYAFILNSKDELVYNRDTSYFENVKLKQKLISIKNMSQGYDSSEKLLTESYKIKDTDWSLVGVSTLSELASIRKNLIQIIVFVSLFLVAIIIYSGNYFARKITKPIEQLEKSMKEVEKGFSKLELVGKPALEIESLAEHFNVMLEKIKRLMLEVKENEGFLRKYELNALHSQINPHFLYNTLDSIVWMAELNEGEKVVDMTKALAQFFRLSLNGGKDITTVFREFSHVEQYLYIQKIRYGDKLNYSIEFEPSIGDCQLLKIVLQPIVENSIYHGIRNKDYGGTIKIVGKRLENGLEIIISDDGVGFDVSNLSKVENDNKLKLGGVGIKNVDSRIKLFYGDAYGLHIESEIGKGTTVTIRLGFLGSGPL